MTVRHRQRKGAKGKSFLYARGKAFPKPQLFRRNRPKIPRRHRITLHTPPAFSASFRPSTAPLPAFFAAKGGFFAPNARRTRLFARPNAPFCPGSARFLPGARPDGDPACPGFARDPGARAHPWDPGSSRVCGFFARPRPLPPAVRRLPARCRRPPPEGQPAAPPRHSLGAGNPDFPGQLFRFAVEKRVPQGGIKSLKSGGWRPRPTLA